GYLAHQEVYVLLRALALRYVARSAGHTHHCAVLEVRAALRANPAFDPVALADDTVLNVVLDRVLCRLLRLLDCRTRPPAVLLMHRTQIRFERARLVRTEPPHPAHSLVPGKNPRAEIPVPSSGARRSQRQAQAVLAFPQGALHRLPLLCRLNEGVAH